MEEWCAAKNMKSLSQTWAMSKIKVRLMIHNCGSVWSVFSVPTSNKAIVAVLLYKLPVVGGLRIHLSLGPCWQTSWSQVMSSHWPSHLLIGSGEAVGQLNKSGQAAESRGLDKHSLIKLMWKQVGVAANERCGQGILQGIVMWGEGLSQAKKDPKQNVFWWRAPFCPVMASLALFHHSQWREANEA